MVKPTYVPPVPLLPAQPVTSQLAFFSVAIVMRGPSCTANLHGGDTPHAYSCCLFSLQKRLLDTTNDTESRLGRLHLE